MTLYRESVSAISKELAKLFPPCLGIHQLELTKPDTLEADIDNEGYHRLAVAWGLSYPETDIGGVTRPGDISDVPPRRRAKPPREFISKDMV